MRETVNALVVSDEAGAPLLGDGDGPCIARALDMARLVERVCADIRDQARVHVALAGGRLDCGDGRELTLLPQQRRHIDYRPAAAVLLEALGPERLAGLVKVGKSDVEDAVMALAPRGQKGAAARELMSRLDAAGAIITTTTDRLECRRAVAQLEECHAAANGDCGDPADQGQGRAG